MKKSLLVPLLLAGLAFGQTPDPTKIPHYFGPYPNWANSPLTTVDANVQISDGCGGDGTGATAVASVDRNGAITAITMTNQGRGYTCAPLVNISSTYGSGASAHATFTPSSGYLSSIVLMNGGSNYFYPIVTISGTGSGATAEAVTDPYSGAVTGITLTNPGTGYTTAAVAITDWGGTGSGASAVAELSNAVIGVVVDTAGSGYKTPGGIRKFVDGLPGLGSGAMNNLGQYISIAHPDTVTYPGSDYYEIAVVEYSRKLHSDLPRTKLRVYVQLNNGTDESGHNTVAPDPIQYLGPLILATKDKPVRVLFKNQLPLGEEGNLFVPVDTTMMGSGMGPAMGGMMEDNNQSVYDGVRNPMCGMMGAKPMGCFTENRATIHLHGGNTPWISDGTPHQWTAPKGESTSYPKGVSVRSVPDMWFDASGNTLAECAGQLTCSVSGATNNPGDGAMTYYYTNQQSARLMFYHDHTWGLTRLNVYVGEAAPYLISDSTEQALMAAGGPLASLGYGMPLVIQDKTFVPGTERLAVQDPTWDVARWGGTGQLWYHHVYMPAQNPADPTGVNPFGRWMYGPWFWPPAGPDTTPYQPIPNPYYVAGCDPATAPNGFCEPPLIPGTPNISVGMEQFNDTPMVNGTLYPTVTLEPKAYRFRILNAANDRFFNLQWYVADSSGTEVALNASEVAAALIDPNVYPTPDTSISPKGPSWIQIGNEGGFLPLPVIVPNQPITWITDPTRFDFGNVDLHSLLLGCAERADVIVDFSGYAGRTLMLYNDAPAAFPARQASYDYYTGHPDFSDVGGAPPTIPGFGPNTRTIMQVKISSGGTAGFDLAALVAAFQHHADGSGVFESSQNPIVVGQAAYNRAYGANFTSSGFCASPDSTFPCDGFARIQQQGGEPFTFDTLAGNKISLVLQPKAMHDEMNASTFDEYGRMQANLGVEAVPATAAGQNGVLLPFVNPATEMINATGLPSTGVRVTPISSATDGTQIWKITHNGVDTHPIHFHLFDVQVLNRVTWDNIILPPDGNELGWKETVRISPLEDTLVAIRPIIPVLPFQLPNSIRPLNPMMPPGSTMGFNSVDTNGNATASPITNDMVNFGWEYMWHCHILSHEEMDMMRAMMLAVPPAAPSLVVTPTVAATNYEVVLTWTDNSISATGFTLQRAKDSSFTSGLVSWPLGDVKTYNDHLAADGNTYFYRVFASNSVGTTQDSGFTLSPGGNSLPTMSVDSGFSNTTSVRAEPLPPTTTFVGAPASASYGSTFTVTATNASGIAPTITGSGACSAGPVSGANPATALITMTSAPGSWAPCNLTANWSATADSVAVTLLQSTQPVGQLVVTAGSATMTYGGLVPTITPAYSGFVNGDTVAAVTTGAACTTTATAASSVGSYSSTCSGAVAANYAITYLPGSVSVGKANSTTAIASTVPSPAAVGQTITVAIRVVPQFTGTPTGSAIVAASTGETCSSTLSATGVGSCTITFTTTGARTLTASYEGDGNFAGSVSAGVSKVVGAVALSPTSLAFGNQVLTTGSVLAVTLTNMGSSDLTISGVTVTGANPSDFSATACPATLGSGMTCTISVTFAPLATGARSAKLIISNSDLTSPQSVTLTGSGVIPVLALPPSTLIFTSSLNVASPLQSVTVRNSGTAPLMINNISLAGMDLGQFAQTNNCPFGSPGLAAGATCRISVRFTPLIAATPLSQVLNVNVSPPATSGQISLIGNVVAITYNVSPLGLTFGVQTIGTSSAAQTVIVSNTSALPLTINNIGLGGTNPLDFTQTNTCKGANRLRPFPATLGAGLSCAINVTFTPTVAGASNASLSVSVGGGATPVTTAVTLTGTGQ